MSSFPIQRSLGTTSYAQPEPGAPELDQLEGEIEEAAPLPADVKVKAGFELLHRGDCAEALAEFNGALALDAKHGQASVGRDYALSSLSKKPNFTKNERKIEEATNEFNRLFPDLNVFGTAFESTVYPTKQVTEAHLKRLKEIKAVYHVGVANSPRLHPRIPLRQLDSLISDVERKLNELEISELSQLLKQSTDHLRTFSLTNPNHLTSIVKTCEEWIATRHKISRLQPNRVENHQQAILDIRECALNGLRRIESLRGPFYTDILRKLKRPGVYSVSIYDADFRRLLRDFNELNADPLTRPFLLLNEAGFRMFTNSVFNHLDGQFANEAKFQGFRRIWSHPYKQKTVSMATLSGWLTEAAAQNRTIEDIDVRLGIPEE